jgi:general secretion pathway protein D
VAVQSGQTVVLGGLIREQKVKSRSGIPGLYNLPIIGPLFGATIEEQVRTELVVLITPRAVRDPAEAAQVTEEFRSKMESLRPLTLPGDKKSDQRGEVKTKRAWPRVGPDEDISEAEPVEPGAEAPAATADSPPSALVLEDL